jgi:hypothetical protein
MKKTVKTKKTAKAKYTWVKWVDPMATPFE